MKAITVSIVTCSDCKGCTVEIEWGGKIREVTVVAANGPGDAPLTEERRSRLMRIAVGFYMLRMGVPDKEITETLRSHVTYQPNEVAAHSPRAGVAMHEHKMPPASELN